MQTSVALWLPPFSPALRGLVFHDFGRLKTLQPAIGAVSYEAVASLGFGVRWQYGASVSVALDYAQVVQGHGPSGAVLNVQNTRGHNRLHVNAIVKF